MPNRITGLNSGLDTESLVMSLVAKDQKRVDDLTGNQKRHSWKQDTWKALNKDVVSFYNGKLSTMSYASAFSKKVTTSTNSSAVTIITSENAMNATQKMRVKSTATSAFATGKQIAKSEGGKVTGATKLSELTGAKPNTWTSEEPVYETVPKRNEAGEIIYKTDEKGDPIYKTNENGEFILDDDGNKIQDYETEQKQVFETVNVTDENNNIVYKKDEDGNDTNVPETKQVPVTETKTHTGYSFTVTVGTGANAKEETLNFESTATINDVVNRLKNLNVGGQKFNANFDENQGRIYMAAATTGEAGTFQFGGANADILTALGFDTSVHGGEDAEIYLNGERYTSSTGTFEINGLTITANEATGEEEFTITTKQDTSGIYDMVKGLLKDYNELIKQMDTKYYADNASKYQMLSDDEKDAMSDKEVEEWEQKIKDGLLSKDQTLYTVIQAMKGVMQGGIEINGKRVYLSDFGINTGSYLQTDQGERGVYHIDGDSDDSVSSANEDKLRNMIATDPELVSTFFSKLAQNMRTALFEQMRTTEYSSSFTIYEDKLMASQYSDYNTKITSATERLNKKTDNYYAKFTRMETAMAKLNSVQSNLTSYFG